MNNDYNYNQYTPESPQREEPKRGDAIRMMVFGIVAAYCAWIPIFSPLGIIFGAIATKGGTNIMFAQPASRATFNFAKAGRITGKVGLIAGIIMTVLYTLVYGSIFLGAISSVF